jgi:hypothetical protein
MTANQELMNPNKLEKMISTGENQDVITSRNMLYKKNSSSSSSHKTIEETIVESKSDRKSCLKSFTNPVTKIKKEVEFNSAVPLNLQKKGS